ncbi:MAG: hypothetical protein K2Q20_08805 [Phycisphaerales bacterium]|nr:hypothetical protein [Phycisphaerales bacterium]
MLIKALVPVLVCSSMVLVAQPGAVSGTEPPGVPARAGDDQGDTLPFPRIPPKFPPREPDGRRPPTDDAITRVTFAQRPSFDALASEDLRDLAISVRENATLEEFVQEIGTAAGVAIHADWQQWGGDGIKKLPIGAPLQGVRVEDALSIFNSRGLLKQRVAARRTGQVIEVSSLRVFDQREVTTRAYDIRALLPGVPMQRDLRLRNVLDVIMTTIEPEGWTQNGGDTSRLSELDGRLFVVAPPRVQAGVSWVLAQVGGREVEDAAR